MITPLERHSKKEKEKLELHNQGYNKLIILLLGGKIQNGRMLEWKLVTGSTLLKMIFF